VKKRPRGPAGPHRDRKEGGAGNVKAAADPGRTEGQAGVPPKLALNAGAFLGFDGEGLVMNVKVENGSDVSLEKVQVTPRASAETIVFGSPTKMISYLKPSETLTLAFPVTFPTETVSGEVWAELEGTGQDSKLSARTVPRKLKGELPELSPVEVTSMAWHQRATVMVRKDEVRSKVYMAASEAFDELLTRVKTTGLFLLDPEVIHTGSSYLGHLKMYAEDAQKRPYAFALDCVGDFQESKITLHFYAESAELVMALRDRMVAALAGKG
jgi:hypothetical protein